VNAKVQHWLCDGLFEPKNMMRALSLHVLLLGSSASSALHIGLICPGHAGHLNPTATLGVELARRGHTVTLISTPPGSATAAKNGLGFEPIGIVEYKSGALRVDLEQEGRLRGLSAFWHTLRLFMREEKILLRDLPEILQTIDAVCVDQLLPAAMDIAEVHGIPAAVLCNALPLHLDPAVPPFVTTWGPADTKWRRLRNRAVNTAIIAAAAPLYLTLNRYRAANGLPKHRATTVQAVGKIQVTQIPSFVDFPRTNLPNHFFYTAPWHESERDCRVSFPWDRLDGRPIVYASFGSVQTGLQSLYLAVVEACRDLPVQLVLSLGRKGAVLPVNPTNNAIIVDYAPQLELLRSASVVLTHAGLNTALEALSVGLPVVTVPLCNDQPGIAARLVRAGVAKATKGRSEPMRKALVHVLEDPSYRRAARRYQHKMRKHCPTVSQTAELIETGLLRSTPLHRDDPEVQRILGIQPICNLTLSSSLLL